MVTSEVETLTLQTVRQTTEQQWEQCRLSSGGRSITYGEALTRHNMSIYQFHDPTLLHITSQLKLLPVTQSARGPVPLTGFHEQIGLDRACTSQ